MLNVEWLWAGPYSDGVMEIKHFGMVDGTTQRSRYELTQLLECIEDAFLCREGTDACCMLRRAGRWDERFELKYLTMRYPAVRLTTSLFKWWKMARELLCFTVCRWSRRQETCLYIYLMSAWVELNLALLTREEEKQGTSSCEAGRKGQVGGILGLFSQRFN